MNNLNGKIALITGNSRGIGPLISSVLAKEGAIIVGVARSEGGLIKTEKMIQNTGGTCYSIPWNLADTSTFEALIETVRETAGEIDILINNAGIEKYNTFEHYAKDDIDSIIDLNLKAPMELVRLTLGRMKERGGHIVNIASLAGKKGVSLNNIYSASKAGVIMWTDGLRQDLRGTKVNVSVICPGFVSEAGMYHDAGVKPPFLLGSSKAEKVASAVLKAIKKNKAQIIVNQGPMKPLLALDQISPTLGDWVLKLFGVPKVSKKRLKN
ncbi:MAG: SDR family NAD(P)-dependent oxidoreductase [Candidatus Marinimicrobia bacterium]|nr:SDR family NAD(P)-dependent oxidoreductase [Candidatus Neomarinimicrobiota bacterium]MBT3618318.1 SDR family NAD(P)-dependent oxidoreductase [Candidatus Neomarinimicrobiota bacterium]MBT3828263.1 SDR family NAD(P)-dependent oxidoreductase [Candidatus Neomarinimicrobiota bacterium]MBT3997180.1 SDR family NAD(P)-dependent oxidoreductase [Candidatus Neomarinimicrobiota bacterium]MBT4280646.1 SDR family NAD(P)-dependent oxidoreductase [Candidatus Neomarinimicrobiota bacterium]